MTMSNISPKIINLSIFSKTGQFLHLKTIPSNEINNLSLYIYIYIYIQSCI